MSIKFEINWDINYDLYIDAREKFNDNYVEKFINKNNLIYMYCYFEFDTEEEALYFKLLYDKIITKLLTDFPI